MDKNIEVIKHTRVRFLELIEGLSIEEMNAIPKGFNNNVIWNFGHVVVSLQILAYKLAGAPMLVDATLVSKYGKGSKPQAVVNEDEFVLLKQLALSTVDDLAIDITTSLFDNYQTYITSFGVALTSVQDAIAYNVMHEGLHLGYAMALKRIVTTTK